jgi:hypothetical protein
MRPGLAARVDLDGARGGVTRWDLEVDAAAADDDWTHWARRSSHSSMSLPPFSPSAPFIRDGRDRGDLPFGVTVVLVEDEVKLVSEPSRLVAERGGAVAEAEAPTGLFGTQTSRSPDGGCSGPKLGDGRSIP